MKITNYNINKCMLYANIISVFLLIQLTKAKCLFRLQKITEQKKKLQIDKVKEF